MAYKTNINVTIDFEVMQQVREKVDNISNLIENLLRQYLELPESNIMVPEDIIQLMGKENELKVKIATAKTQLEQIQMEKKKRGVIEI